MTTLEAVINSMTETQKNAMYYAVEQASAFYNPSTVEKIKILTEPEKIIQNGPVVVVFWKDNTKTIVRKKPNDPDDIYSAVAQAFMKKWCGSTSHFHKCIDKMVVKKEEKR